MSLLGLPNIAQLEQGLDAAVLRHKVIANNVANVDTPYFKRSDVRFEELLQQQLRPQSSIRGYRTDPRHFHIGHNRTSAVSPEIVESSGVAMNNNMNNVDIDYEMALHAFNQLRYNVMIQETNNEFRRTRIALDGRR